MKAEGEGPRETGETQGTESGRGPLTWDSVSRAKTTCSGVCFLSVRDETPMPQHLCPSLPPALNSRCTHCPSFNTHLPLVVSWGCSSLPAGQGASSSGAQNGVLWERGDTLPRTMLGTWWVAEGRGHPMPVWGHVAPLKQCVFFCFLCRHRQL